MARKRSACFFFAIRFFCALMFVLIYVPESALAAGVCGTGSWQTGNLEIHHINIGQGDATLIVGPTGRSLLFDAGEANWNSSAKAQIIGPYIESVLGCKSLDYVIISHFHLDHIGYVGYGGLWNLVEAQGFTVGATLVRNYTTHLGDVSGTFTNWKTYMEGAGAARLHPAWASEGTGQVNLGPGVTFNIVSVNGNGSLLAGDFHVDPSPPSENDYSIGALLSYGSFDEWIGGDLDGQYQVGGFGYTYHDVELSVARDVGDVDVIKANHHASSHSNSATFISQLDPEVSIVTVGNGNTYGHPTQEIMNRLLGTSTVFMTERGDTNTSIGSAIVAGHIVIKTSNGATYTVNGTTFTATEPARTDVDGDGYFAEADSNDSNPGALPAPNGGCGPIYQICSLSCQVTPGQVLINEILPSPSSGPEWVELYNTTASTINLGYCFIDDIPAGSTAYQIPAGTLIPAHGFWTLDQTSYFNNTGDDVRLLDEDASTVLDAYTFGNTGYDLAWYRFPDGGPWAGSPRASTTKGQTNSPASFVDVPSYYWAWSYVERLYDAGITSGCSTTPMMFCPDQPVTRGQMAVFIEKSLGNNAPNPSPTGMFSDVLLNDPFKPFVEEFYNDGITSGCATNPLRYCPNQVVTRGQMAVFLERAMGNLAPAPNPTGMFSDVPNDGFRPFIEELYNDGITSGCSTSPLRYCPNASVTRAQMAVFLVKAFNLP